MGELNPKNTKTVLYDHESTAHIDDFRVLFE